MLYFKVFKKIKFRKLKLATNKIIFKIKHHKVRYNLSVEYNL